MWTRTISCRFDFSYWVTSFNSNFNIKSVIPQIEQLIGKRVLEKVLPTSMHFVILKFPYFECAFEEVYVPFSQIAFYTCKILCSNQIDSQCFNWFLSSHDNIVNFYKTFIKTFPCLHRPHLYVFTALLFLPRIYPI